MPVAVEHVPIGDPSQWRGCGGGEELFKRVDAAGHEHAPVAPPTVLNADARHLAIWVQFSTRAGEDRAQVRQRRTWVAYPPGVGTDPARKATGSDPAQNSARADQDP